MNEMLTAALAYAERGWPVFPCVAKEKMPLTSHGFKDATTNPAQITAWWTRWPRANVAVATGAPGPDVLDVDIKDGRPGMDLFDRARHAGLVRSAAAIIRTPSGGLHIWFAGTEQGGGAVGGDRALELKARGGYVLLPPSYVEDVTYDYAGRYELIERREGPGGTVDFAAIRRLLDPPRAHRPSGVRTGSGSLAALVRFVAGQRPGNRNHALFWAACRAYERGANEVVLRALIDAAVSTGLIERAAQATVESAKNAAVSA